MKYQKKLFQAIHNIIYLFIYYLFNNIIYFLCRVVSFLSYLSVAACEPGDAFNEYPDSGHSHLRLYETRRVSITSQPYRDACKMSKETNYRKYQPDPRGDEHPPIKNDGVVEYYIKKRRTNREEVQDLPEYQYIASRNPIHPLEDILNWNPNSASFPIAEPEPILGRNVFDTTLGSIYCGSSRIENLWLGSPIKGRNKYQESCGIGELLVQACLNDDEHVLSVALSDDELFGAEGNVRGIQGGVRDHKRQKCQDFVEVVIRDRANSKYKGGKNKARQYWLIIYLRGALRSNYDQLIALQKSCIPRHRCGPKDEKCIDESSWVIHETQHVIREYENYQREDQGDEFNFWVDISTRVIADRWYFCRYDLGLLT